MPRSTTRGVLALTLAATRVVAATASGRPSRPSTPSPPPPRACSGRWHPAIDTSWNWVIGNVPKSPFRSVKMYDIDGFDAAAGDVSALHAAGIKVVCYIDAGTWENWRPDANKFPKRLLGKNNGWPGEKWLDVRAVQSPGSVLLSIMQARLDMCKQKGFDGVELDNVDGYTNSTGFPLSAAGQLYFNATLANQVHLRGLMVLQKNDLEQIPKLVTYFDAALNEQCNQYQECTTGQNGSYGYDQYVAQGKAVFQAEYQLATSRFCPSDNAQNFNGVRLSINLDDSVFQPCRS
jgi:Glycoside-hydrolase family GH114